MTAARKVETRLVIGLTHSNHATERTFVAAWLHVNCRRGEHPDLDQEWNHVTEIAIGNIQRREQRSQSGSKQRHDRKHHRCEEQVPRRVHAAGNREGVAHRNQRQQTAGHEEVNGRSATAAKGTAKRGK